LLKKKEKEKEKEKEKKKLVLGNVVIVYFALGNFGHGGGADAVLVRLLGVEHGPKQIRENGRLFLLLVKSPRHVAILDNGFGRHAHLIHKANNDKDKAHKQ
jgi:hypothetical protein